MPASSKSPGIRSEGCSRRELTREACRPRLRGRDRGRARVRSRAAHTALETVSSGVRSTPSRAHYSLPSINWVRWPSGEDRLPGPTPMYPLEEILDGAVGAGFRSVGLDRAPSGARFRSGDESTRSVRRSARVDSSAAMSTSCGWARKTRSRRPTALARLASSTGAEVCIAVFCAPVSDGRCGDVRACADVLSDVGTRLALEFAPYGHLKTLGEAVDISGAVGWERCALLVDTWHFFRSGAPWELFRVARRSSDSARPSYRRCAASDGLRSQR